MSRANLAALAILISINAVADVVHFKNGDRLTGDRVAAEAGFVAIDVPQLGVWKIPDALIARVESAEDAAPPAEPSTAAASTISGLIDAWDVIADLAATTATGNTETSDLNFVSSATRTGERFDHVLGATWHRGEVADVATSEQLLAKDQLDLNYDLRWKYRESWYAVANFEYFRDPIKDIDRRYTAGAGFGHTFWTSPRGTLSTDGGVSQVFEKLASVPRRIHVGQQPGTALEPELPALAGTGASRTVPQQPVAAHPRVRPRAPCGTRTRGCDCT